MASKGFIGSLFGHIGLNTNGLEKGLKKAKKQLKSFSRDTKQLGTTLFRNVGVPLTAMGTVATKSFADFEKGMKEVQTLVPDLHDVNFDRMIDSTRELAEEMGTNLVDATGALYQTISAGIDPNNAVSFLETASKGAIAGVSDMATAVDGLSTVINAYGMDARDTEKISDSMFTAVRLGKTTFDEISSSMFQIVPLASSMNVKFDEVMSGLVALTKQGVPTKIAFTQMRAAMSNIIKPTAEMEKAIKSLGFRTGEDLLGSRGFIGAIQAIRTESGLSAEEVVKAFGSVEGLSAVLALTGKNFGVTQQIMSQMRVSAGATEEAFKVMSETSSFKFNQLKVAVQNLGVEIGEKLAPHVTKFVESIRTFINENSDTLVQLGELGAKVGVVSMAVGLMLLILSPLIASLFLVAPIVAGIFIGFEAFRQENESIMDAISRLIDIVEEQITKFKEYVSQFDSFEDLLSHVKDEVVKHLEKMRIKVKVQFNKMLRDTEAFRDSFMDVFDTLYNSFAVFYNAIQGIQNVGIAIDNFALGTSRPFNQTIEYRANGGMVNANSPYIVGERGAELFVPDVNGKIIPNEKMGDNISMSFGDGTDFSTVAMLKNMKSDIGKIAIDAVNDYRMRTA
jgi:TP901 family phage tail tape measure protein